MCRKNVTLAKRRKRCIATRRKDRYSLVQLPWKVEERDTIPLKKTTSSSRHLNVNILESSVSRYECIGGVRQPLRPLVTSRFPLFCSPFALLRKRSGKN